MSPPYDIENCAACEQESKQADPEHHSAQFYNLSICGKRVAQQANQTHQK
jgi:hypothetical protein